MYGGVQEARASAHNHTTREDAVAHNRREVREEEGAAGDHQGDSCARAGAAAHQGRREDGRHPSEISAVRSETNGYRRRRR